jgi:hypothetical protein
MRPELLDCVATGSRFCDHSHVRLNADEPGDPFADELMVVDGENSYR